MKIFGKCKGNIRVKLKLIKKNKYYNKLNWKSGFNQIFRISVKILQNSFLSFKIKLTQFQM